MLERFEFKVFYSIYREALMDKETTISVQKLFQPIFDIRGPFPNNPKKKDDDEYLEITSRRASEWIGGKRCQKGCRISSAR